jgi:hypothetical protein
MKPKDLPFMHPKKGRMTLGDLSKNELCRYVLDLLKYQNMMHEQLSMSFTVYANHIASIEAYPERGSA